MEQYRTHGKILRGLGGLYDVRLDGNERVSCRAKGVLKRDEEKVMVGDNVLVSIDESTPNGIVISEVLKRKNSLIRPPVSNLDYLFIVFAAKKPSPVIETVDKLISIAEYNKITPVLIISKSDLSSDAALEYKKIYDNVGIDSFVTSSLSGDGVGELLECSFSKSCISDVRYIKKDRKRKAHYAPRRNFRHLFVFGHGIFSGYTGFFSY